MIHFACLCRSTMSTLITYSLWVKGEGPIDAISMEDRLHNVVVWTMQPERVVAKPLPQDGVAL